MPAPGPDSVARHARSVAERRPARPAEASGYRGRMDLRDDQPMVHEIGNRTYIVADVEPLDLDGVRTIQVGYGALGDRVRRAAPVLRPARGRRPPVVALDLPGRLRARPVRLEYCRRRRKAARASGRLAHDDALRTPPTRWQLAGDRPGGLRRALRRLVAERRGHRRRGPAGRRAGCRAGRGSSTSAPGWAGSRTRCGGAATRSSPSSPTRRCASSRGVRTPTWRCVAAPGTRARRPPSTARLRPGRGRRQRDGVPGRGHRARGADPAARPAGAGWPHRWRASTSTATDERQPDLPGRRVRGGRSPRPDSRSTSGSGPTSCTRPCDDYAVWILSAAD